MGRLSATLCAGSVALLFAGQLQAKSNLETSGDVVQILVPASGLAATVLTGDRQGRQEFTKSFFSNLVVVHSLKRLINKPRQENNGDYSFPSGHTAAAFQGAAFIHQRYGIRYGLPAYAAASFVGWSRIEGESDKHDIVDVTAGAMIGTLSSVYFTTPYARQGLTLSPALSPGFSGLAINYRW